MKPILIAVATSLFLLVSCAGINPLVPKTTSSSSSETNSSTNTSSTSSTVGLIMWNKLGSALEISNSSYGPMLTNMGGVTFSNGQFGNGFIPGAASWLEGRASNYINSNRGTIEFWVTPQSMGSGQNFFFEFTTNGQTSGNFLGYSIQTAGTLQFGVTFGAAVVDLRPAATFTTGTPAHIAFVWDCSGIADGSGQTHQVYKDGVKVGGHTNAAAKMPSYSTSMMRVGTSWDNNGRQVKGVMDNLKTWNYAKTDFSDRFTE